MKDWELEVRVRVLESRLERYHEHLENTLRHDREFLLGASWGTVTSLSGIAAFLAVIWITGKFGLSDGLAGAVAALLGIVAWFLAGAWSDRGREQDIKKLSRLPQWDAD